MALAELGFRVSPLTLEGGRSLAGHPRTPYGIRDASRDLDLIERWWSRWPDANIGIATGGGLAVLEMIVRDGGEASLERLEWEVGALPPPTVRTGEGGLLFFMVGEVHPRVRLGHGLVLHQDGGFVAAPPSGCRNGIPSEWIEGPWQGLPEIPSALRRFIEDRR